MREGFRSEDWVVKRTPINTPVAAADDGNKQLVVGMINLSDEDDDEVGLDEEKSEEDETSLHLDSEAVFKSGATTPPEGGGNGGEDDSMRSSLAPSSLGFEGGPATAAAVAAVETAKVPAQVASFAKDEEKKKGEVAEAKTPVEELEPLDVSPPKMQQQADAGAGAGAASSIPFVKPPQGFGDSPEKNRQQLPGCKMHLATEQLLQPEELLTAEQHAAAASEPEAAAAKMTPLPSQSSSKPSSSTCSTLEKKQASSLSGGGGGGGNSHGRRSSGSGGSGSGAHGA